MCKTEICGICQHKSWTGCGKHVSQIMDITPKDGWCTCEPVDTSDIIINGDFSYPPRAGTGFARRMSKT
ncbi:hypothetical protein G9P44_000879 [Scheffersomyces stipitis]|nr:hypothetical protein G9P44_000879 [Scheffersomyces stipitis]